MTLDTITTGKKNTPRRLLLYGVQGIGKSTFAANAPAPIFIPTEDGLDDIDCFSFPICKSLDDVFEHLKTLYEQKHEFKTVVIDSLDWLERLIHVEVAKKANVDSIEDIGYAKGYTFALQHWGRLCAALNCLRTDRGMHAVLLAHARISRFSPPDGEPYDRYAPKLHKLASEQMQEFCDEVFFATYRVFQKTTGEGFNKRTIGVGTGERVIHTSERPSHAAKHRCEIADEVPLDWCEYATAASAF